MHVFLSFIIQLAGFYILYSTSARRRTTNQYRLILRALGGLLLLVSLILFMINLGISVGILFAVTSFMAMSGCMIMLLPLFKK